MMDLGFLQEYIVAVVMGTCFCVGVIIKTSLDFIPNKYIPLIMGVLGVVLNIWSANWDITPAIVLGGLASGLGATGAYEFGKNTFKKEEATEE